jgi:membrane-associated protease RseP (regulator of RpoE activity)
VSIVLTIIFVLFIITVVVTLHELGHYFAARWYGIPASSFSIGFGPEIIGRTDTRGTRWKISAIPLGGYVKLTDHEKVGMGMLGMVPWRGFALITVAGCLVNFITGWLYLTLVSGQAWLGFYFAKLMIVDLPRGMVGTVAHPGGDVALAGPIGIVDVFSGNPTLLIGAFPIISLSLAIINMVPLPMLDGGHLVFGSVEHLRGKKFGEKSEFAFTFVSLFAVLLLFGFTTLSDLVRIFS